MKKQTLARTLAFVLLAVALALILPRLGTWMESLVAPTSPPPKESGSALEVYFLNVGQADCILAKQGSHAALIDAGGNATADTLVGTLRDLGVTRFDVVIGTHPHEDHIGGLDAVLRAFPTDTLIMPKITHDTKTFRDVLDAAEACRLQITTPKAGTRYDVGQAVLTLLHDGIDEDNLNNCSVVSRLVFAERSVLLTGDAEAEVEAKLVDANITIRSDFLKVGHHGSNTSSTPEFLSAVRPTAAFISCGVDNSYQHPHATTLRKLQDLCLNGVFRTDMNGTVRLTVQTDGTFHIAAEKGA